MVNCWTLSEPVLVVYSAAYTILKLFLGNCSILLLGCACPVTRGENASAGAGQTWPVNYSGRPVCSNSIRWVSIYSFLETEDPRISQPRGPPAGFDQQLFGEMVRAHFGSGFRGHRRFRPLEEGTCEGLGFKHNFSILLRLVFRVELKSQLGLWICPFLYRR